MIRHYSANKSHENLLTKYRFPIWLTIFFFLVFSIPFLAFLGYIVIAKFFGITCLILVVIALRIWLRSSRINSLKIERFVLNRNQIFELERNYPFFKKLNQSDKQIIIHRSGLLLAELNLIPSDANFSIDNLIEIAFNQSIILMDQEYYNFNGLKVNVSFESREGFLSISDLPESKLRSELPDYKLNLSKSKFATIFKNLLTSQDISA
jgi:hypothetical protein